MTDEEVIEQRHSLEMMRRPHLWSSTVLPLKKRAGDTSLEWSEAILVCTHWTMYPMDRSRLYQVLRNHNMFLPIQEGEQWEQGGDDLLVKLVGEGWEVD